MIQKKSIHAAKLRRYFLMLSAIPSFYLSTPVAWANTQLFDTLYERIQKREAFSPIKDQRWGETFDDRINRLNLRQRFRDASTKEELYAAVNMLSAARCDAHLRIGDMNLNVSEGSYKTPIRFLPDLQKFRQDKMLEGVRYFVSQKGNDSSVSTVVVGDELLEVNGYPLAEYLNLMLPNYQMSTLAGGLIGQLAGGLSRYYSTRDQLLYPNGKQASYRLRRPDGSMYLVTPEYTYSSFSKVTWEGENPLYTREYPGFRQAISTIDYDLYVPTNTARKTLLIRWKDYEQVKDTLSQLDEYITKNNMWNYNVVIDAAVSSGGSGSPLLIKRLAKQPFKTTFGNVRCSDITDKFSRAQNFSRRKWIEDYCTQGFEYTSSEPFKLRYFSEGSNGIMQPAEKHFTGNVAAIFGPYGGSNHDQMASMFIDNNIGVSFGLPTGGYSNTWEWVEEVAGFKFMYSIGHTLRPNGEILEGNPAEPLLRHPLQKNNFTSYFDELVKMAVYEVENRQNVSLPQGIVGIINSNTKGFLGLSSGEVVWSNHGRSENRWALVKKNDGTAYLSHVGSGEFLGMNAAGQATISTVQSAEQAWKLIPLGDQFVIKNSKYSYYLDAGSNNKIEMSSSSLSPSQHWSMTFRQNTIHTDMDTSDAKGNSTSLQAHIIQLKNVGNKGYLTDKADNIIHQKDASYWGACWELVADQSDDCFYLRNTSTKKYLDYDSDHSIDNSWNKEKDKCWHLIRKNGAYLIKNSMGKRYLDADRRGHVDTSPNTNADKLWRIELVK